MQVVKQTLVMVISFVLGFGIAYANEPDLRPDTFTDIEANKDMLDPQNLGLLIEKGDVKAMNNVGLLWATGYDGKQSFEEAVKWWQEAANRGYPLAMNNLGLAYANGQGVKRDIKQAFNWWLKSAIGGSAWAMNSVGDCYETGEGVTRDYVLAMSWYKTAADAGDPLAHFNVGSLYHTGRGVDQSYETAIGWFEKGAGFGDPYSMLSLAEIYRDGLGVDQDLVEALAWYKVTDLRLEPQDKGSKQLVSEEVTKIANKLDKSQMKRVFERLEFLTTLTAPQVPEGRLDEGESRI